MIIDLILYIKKKVHLSLIARKEKFLKPKVWFTKSSLSTASQGSRVTFLNEDGNKYYGEVVSISTDSCFVMPYQDVLGVNSRTKVFCNYDSNEISVCHELLGRVVDAFGKPLDGKGQLNLITHTPKALIESRSTPLRDLQLMRSLNFGIRAIDSFVTVGKGQRISILAGSGIGKVGFTWDDGEKFICTSKCNWSCWRAGTRGQRVY